MKKYALLLITISSFACFAANQENNLIIAVKKGDIQAATKAIQQGVPINDPNADGISPLMLAADIGNEKLVKLLLKKGANINWSNGYVPVAGETALMFAAKKGFLNIMQLLIDAGADVNAVAFADFPRAGEPVLHYAIDSGSKKAVRLLINAGANVNQMTGHGIIHRKRKKANVRNIPLLSYAINTHAPIDIIDELIAGGANVNKRALFVEWTPLMVAAYKGYNEAVKALLAAKADKTLKNKQDGGRTALNYAKEQGDQEIITLLQDKKGRKSFWSWFGL